MRRPVLALTVAVALLGVSLRADDVLFGLFGAYLESLRSQAGIPGLSAAVIGANGILWEQAFGQQDVARSIATRTDTPFPLDDLTQVFTATLVLRCVEEGQLSLDDRIGQYDAGSPDANSTIRQVLTFTSAGVNGLVFAYRPERLGPLAFAVSACTGESFRARLAQGFDGLGMVASVPGLDAVGLVPPDADIPAGDVARYAATLGRLAVPYAVDKQGHPSPSQYTAATLTPASGAVSTVDDFARFDLALKQGVILRSNTLAAAWQPPLDPTGGRCPMASAGSCRPTTTRPSSGSSASATTPPRPLW